MESVRFDKDSFCLRLKRALAVEKYYRVIRQIIQKRPLLHAEQQREPFESRELRIVEIPNANVFRVLFGQDFQIFFKCFRTNGDFAFGKHRDAVKFRNGALRADIELADCLDHILEELNSHRGIGTGRE